MLDIDHLLQPKDADAPCGEDLEYDSAYIALEQKAKETPEIQIGDKIVVPYQPPNWKEVRREVIELMEKTIDLRLMLLLCRASLAVEGVLGFQQSLDLMHTGLTQYWDTIHPQLDPDDDNDPTLRVNVLESLCDQDTLLKDFSNTALVESRAIGRFTLRQIQTATGKLQAFSTEAPIDPATLNAAFSDSDPEKLKETHIALENTLISVQGIESFVLDQVGMSNSANLQPLQNLLKEAIQIFKELEPGDIIGSHAEFAESPKEQQSPENPVFVEARKPQAQVTGIANRQDVIKALQLICEYYANNEPSSPVPLLAKRAQRLVNMDFMAIMSDLAPDGLTQIELIKGQDPNKTEE